MLILQQSAQRAGVLAPAIALSCWSGPMDPPTQIRHQTAASPPGHRDTL